MREYPVGEHGARLLFPDGEEHLLTIIASGQWYEQSVLRKLHSLVEPGVRFLDVGAHLGNHTVYFATECEASHVLAIEPHPWTYETLRMTIALNEIQEVVQAARVLVHPSWETAAVDFEEDPETPWMRSMLPRITEGGDTPCVTLDRALEPGFDVVKIDVEDMGHEVLASGLTELDRQSPVVCIEAQTPPEEQHVTELLTPLGYTNLGQFQEHGTPTFIWQRQ